MRNKDVRFAIHKVFVYFDEHIFKVIFAYSLSHIETFLLHLMFLEKFLIKVFSSLVYFHCHVV